MGYEITKEDIMGVEYYMLSQLRDTSEERYGAYEENSMKVHMDQR